MPVRGGRAVSRLVNACRPPAEAPTATVRKGRIPGERTGDASVRSGNGGLVTARRDAVDVLSVLLYPKRRIANGEGLADPRVRL